jgi:hypothetical protein
VLLGGRDFSAGDKCPLIMGFTPEASAAKAENQEQRLWPS